MLLDLGEARLAEHLLGELDSPCCAESGTALTEVTWAFEAVSGQRVQAKYGPSGTLKDEIAGDPSHQKFAPMREKFAAAVSDDLNTSIALVALEEALAVKKVDGGVKRAVIEDMDRVLGLDLFSLTREDLRIRPVSAEITETEIEAELVRRKEARVLKDFAASDAIRETLAVKGVEVMDGDPLGWEWKLG